MAGGRPSLYNETLAKLICERVAHNTVGLEELVKMYDDMPEHTTIKAWRTQYPRFSAWYNEAKAFQAQIMVEEMDNMIDSNLNYFVDDKGNKRIDPPSASLLMAKINNRKWQAARLAPKLYGERMHVENTNTSETDALKAEIKELRAKLDAKNKKDY